MTNKNQYLNAYGNWTVTTEGDCEGRTTRNLGTYIGFVDEIAFHLADQSYYSLTFKRNPDQNEVRFQPKATKVNVKFAIDSNTWDMSGKMRAKFWSEAIKTSQSGLDVTVTEGNYFASVYLELKNEELLQKHIREQALGKLTLEERRALGVE